MYPLTILDRSLRYFAYTLRICCVHALNIFVYILSENIFISTSKCTSTKSIRLFVYFLSKNLHMLIEIISVSIESIITYIR